LSTPWYNIAVSAPRPFRSYSAYLKENYGEAVYRVAVDAGFSCPNRGPDRSSPGCSYCDDQGARAPYLAGIREIHSQIDQGLRVMRRRYGARLYALYFQAFCGTFAPAQRLKEIYDGALSCAPFRQMIVSTRPDCIDEAVADLLAGYRSPGLEVWVELGLQSASDRSLKRIRRGHTVECFAKAYKLLQQRGLKQTVHLIFGLPGEGLAEILETARYVAGLVPEGIKIHNLHIPRGSPLYQEYLCGELTVPTDRRHLEYVIRALELLPPETVIMRLTCETPEPRRACPRRTWPKALFYRRLALEMGRRETWQGRLYRLG